MKPAPMHLFIHIYNLNQVSPSQTPLFIVRLINASIVISKLSVLQIDQQGFVALAFCRSPHRIPISHSHEDPSSAPLHHLQHHHSMNEQWSFPLTSHIRSMQTLRV